MSAYSQRPTFPVDLRADPGSGIVLTRQGTAMRIGLTGRGAEAHTAAPDADYVALATDVQIGFAVLAAARTVTLPDVDSYPLGQILFIADESGQCSVDRPITIEVAPGSSDSIAGLPAIQITDAYQGIGFRRGAANVWIIAR